MYAAASSRLDTTCVHMGAWYVHMWVGYVRCIVLDGSMGKGVNDSCMCSVCALYESTTGPELRAVLVARSYMAAYILLHLLT